MHGHVVIGLDKLHCDCWQPQLKASVVLIEKLDLCNMNLLDPQNDCSKRKVLVNQ